ncbi:type-F conjugative transfer system secretin TraK [Novosphingobium sp. BL-52-GroH]|uniref:type-F conjugative transfer system secretin TraK n=1 Tax=Novosphingobium sp. BL-52-GroH TaxID=3349877 RepID=UPI00384A604D
MRRSERRSAPWVLALCVLAGAGHAQAQAIIALPEQTSNIRLSNHDLNHLVCQGGEIEDVRFSAEKAISVERAGSDAWVKFLVREIEGEVVPTRTYATAPAEFFVSCNGAIYPLYAQPSDIPAQTVMLGTGVSQRARANADLLGPLVEEERAVSITLSMLRDQVPASFADVAPATEDITIASLGHAALHERRRIAVDGAGLSASEYLVTAASDMNLDERSFLDSALGSNIFSVTLDRIQLALGDTARLIVVRRGEGQ